jgi:hypothetical protein
MQLQSNRVELGTRKKHKLEYSVHVTVPVEWTWYRTDPSHRRKGSFTLTNTRIGLAHIKLIRPCNHYLFDLDDKFLLLPAFGGKPKQNKLRVVLQVCVCSSSISDLGSDRIRAIVVLTKSRVSRSDPMRL